jgi:hypothetical protein
MKKFLSLLTALLISLGILTVGTTGASGGPAISDWGKQAVQQIATCVNSSGQKDVVNVLFMIDESGSLRWNDKQNLRVEGLKSALEQFASIAEYRPYFTVNRAFSTFAEDFKVIDGKGWAKLDKKSLDGDKNWIDSKVPGLTGGQTTDYARALDGAYNYMKPQVTSNSCNILLWFTDGALNVGPSVTARPTVAATEKAYQEICAVNPRTGAPTGGVAIIDKFRKSGINIQGILLRNTDVISNPAKYNLDQTDVDDESRGMTYFKPIVEYSGSVDTAYFGGSSKLDIECGSPVGAKGVVTEVGDPIDIIWPPTQFECITSSGRVIEATGGVINIDPGFTRFKASALKDGFSLKNASGQVLASSKGASVADVQVSYFGADEVAISASGKVIEESVLAPGKWTFTTKDYARSVFCGYLDISIDIKNDPCYAGESCAFNGRITQLGSFVNFDDYKSKNLRYGFVDPTNQSISYSNLIFDDSGKFKASFNPTGRTDSLGLANLIVTLDVTTKSGYEFTFSAIQQVQPLEPGIYPEVNPNPINVSDFTTPLDGKSGAATAPLTIKGPSRTNGEVCFKDLEVRTDPSPNRVNGYQTTLDGKNLKDINCIPVAAGERLNYILEIKNSESDDGIVSGFIPVVFKSDGQQDIAGQVPVSFETKVKINDVRFWIIFALCMFLGLMLPLTVLKILQLRAARIAVSPLSKATTPVLLSASGGFVSLKRAEKGSGTDIFTESDFEGFMHSDSKEKQIQIGSESLRGNAPLNPFAAPRAILATSPGMIVASSDIWSTNKHGLERHETVASLNPAFAMHLTLSETALAALKAMNQTGDASDFPIEGNITGLLNFNSADPVTQVNALNLKLSTDAGWLNNLLKIEDMLANSTKGGAAIPGGGLDQPTKPIDDGWGTTSAPTSTTKSTAQGSTTTSSDGWGSSTTSSNEDWGTTGNSGSSSSKNDDW